MANALAALLQAVWDAMTQTRWYEAVGSLAYLGAFTLIVAVLSRGKAVLIPLVLAGFFAFILSQPVKMLEHWRVPRALAVVFVLTFTLGLVGGFGYLLERQLDELAAQMPAYSRAIRGKLTALRATHGSVATIQEAIDKVSDDLDRQEAMTPEARSRVAPTRAQPVRVLPEKPTDLERLVETMESIFEPLATTVIVLVLTAFMLVQREELRNRFIRLVGQRRMMATTRTMDEAGQRISQFLLAQTLINLAFGALITAGLFLIGLPYAALWGFSAAVLRFVPFVGVFFATVMPAAVAFILFEGWTPTLATLGLFLVADLVTAYVVEPLGIGYRTGVSSLALLVMAMIWTWLWGPIGLLLSTPITVCLATLGKHVPSLEFLNVVLGDAAPLPAHAAYYQRLLARDDDEAGEIIEQELATRSRLEVFDQVLIPALAWATRDRAREDITQAEQQFVLDVTEAMISEAGERSDEGAVGQPHPETEESLGKVFGVPARGAGDDLVLEMLGRLLDSAEVSFERISPSVLVAELIEKSREERPQVICIGSLPPGGLHQARYLCKRLRAVFPKLRIVVLRPCADQEEREGGARLQDAGVDLVAWSLGDAVSEIERALKTVAASLPSADSAPAGPADEGREVASA